MSITNFPTALQGIIQTNYLDHRFEQALRSRLAYRAIADKKEFMARIGQTITDTRAGLLAPATTALTPSSNTNFDNGMSVTNWAMEQFTVSLNMYGNTMDLNMVTDRVGIANQYVQNGIALAFNAAQSMDELAQVALFNAYMGGNTRVRTTLGSAGPTVSVDDIRGFQNVWVNGVPVSVSSTNYITVLIGSDNYNIGTVTADGSNVSTAPGGISGTLTTVSGNITTADGTALNVVQAVGAAGTAAATVGATILRPSGRTTTAALQAGDLLAMSNILDGVAFLRKNAIPTVNGLYNCYLDPVSARQLFADPDFKELFRAVNNGMPNEFRRGQLESDMLGVRFVETTQAYVQSAVSVTGAYVRRPIICGQGALIEGNFAGMAAQDVRPADSQIFEVDNVVHVTREPLDRFQQIVAQSWYWVGGYTAPTDVTTNTTTVPTATNAAWKRGVIIEHIG